MDTIFFLKTTFGIWLRLTHFSYWNKWKQVLICLNLRYKLASWLYSIKHHLSFLSLWSYYINQQCYLRICNSIFGWTFQICFCTVILQMLYVKKLHFHTILILYFVFKNNWEIKQHVIHKCMQYVWVIWRLLFQFPLHVFFYNIFI